MTGVASLCQTESAPLRADVQRRKDAGVCAFNFTKMINADTAVPNAGITNRYQSVDAARIPSMARARKGAGRVVSAVRSDLIAFSRDSAARGLCRVAWLVHVLSDVRGTNACVTVHTSAARTSSRVMRLKKMRFRSLIQPRPRPKTPTLPRA